MEILDADSLTRIWQKLMSASGKSWVLFRRGTCVALEHQTSDLRAQATALMKEWGPVQVATPSADFNVLKLPDDSGWLVTCHHPDISTYVSPDEFGNQNVSDVFIGLTGRSKRDQDSRELNIIHSSMSPR
jgi:hypothetical protein